MNTEYILTNSHTIAMLFPTKYGPSFDWLCGFYFCLIYIYIYHVASHVRLNINIYNIRVNTYPAASNGNAKQLDW